MRRNVNEKTPFLPVMIISVERPVLHKKKEIPEIKTNWTLSVKSSKDRDTLHLSTI